MDFCVIWLLPLLIQDSYHAKLASFNDELEDAPKHTKVEQKE